MSTDEAKSTEFQVRPLLAERFAVVEQITQGRAGSVRHVAEFFSREEAEEYAAWKREITP